MDWNYSHVAAAIASQSNPTALHVWHSPRFYTAASASTAASVAPTVVDVLNATDFQASEQDWSRALRSRPGALNVAVIGDSVANGCGAAGPSDLTCDLGRGWVRVMKDWLDALLQPLGRKVHLDAFAKNAIGPNYFFQCTSTLFSHHIPQVIILCFESMLGLKTSDDLAMSSSNTNRFVPTRPTQLHALGQNSARHARTGRSQKVHPATGSRAAHRSPSPARAARAHLLPRMARLHACDLPADSKDGESPRG